MTHRDEYSTPLTEVLGTGAAWAPLQTSDPLENPTEGGEWGWD